MLLRARVANSKWRVIEGEEIFFIFFWSAALTPLVRSFSGLSCADDMR